MSIQVSIQASDAVTAYARSFGEKLLSTAPTRRAVLASCEAVGVTHAEVSITWLRDDEIAELNQEYLEHAGATDVISFHLYEPGELPVGDIYIGYEQALRQAGTFGSTHAEELMRLAVHGTLHILGFEHPDEARTDSTMWMLQEAIMSELTR